MKLIITKQEIIEKFNLPFDCDIEFAGSENIINSLHKNTITFPNLTAKEIVDACNNKVNGVPLLYSTWMNNEAFYTTEKTRPRTVSIPTEIEHMGKSWNECHEADSADMYNVAEILYMARENEAFRKLLENKYTWTSSRNSAGELVRVGYFDSSGARVRRWEPGSSASRVGVCFSRSVN